MKTVPQKTNGVINELTVQFKKLLTFRTEGEKRVKIKYKKVSRMSVKNVGTKNTDQKSVVAVVVVVAVAVDVAVVLIVVVVVAVVVVVLSTFSWELR